MLVTTGGNQTANSLGELHDQDDGEPNAVVDRKRKRPQGYADSALRYRFCHVAGVWAYVYERARGLRVEGMEVRKTGSMV